jgi:hypothetical protein
MPWITMMEGMLNENHLSAGNPEKTISGIPDNITFRL